MTVSVSLIGNYNDFVDVKYVVVGVQSKGARCDGKLPQFNWSQHANAHESFSRQKKFLSSSFFYSLPTQKPRAEGTIGARVMAFTNGSPVQKPQALKAWDKLSSLKETRQNYLKIGKTAPLVQRGGADNLPTQRVSSHQDTRPKSTLWSSSDTAPQFSGNSMHGKFGGYQNSTHSNPMVSEPVIQDNNSFQRSRVDVTESDRGYNKEQQNERQTSSFSSPAHTVNGFSNNHVLRNNLGGNELGDGIDEDDILMSIDIDQIAIQHFQSTHVPQSSTSKPPPFTPLMKKDNGERLHEACLPPEISTICNHSFKVALCPEAATHLREMKDMLLSISNDLLDNTDLSPSRMEKLRQDRLQLNKQVQPLEKYLQSVSLDGERQNSHYLASTASSTVYQSETPGFRIDSMRFDAQVHIHTDPGSCDNWASSYPSTDRFGVSPAPIEREPYIPKGIEINYVEGSNDGKWSSSDFTWTKKLEASNRKFFGNRSFRPNQREVINATMSGFDVFVLMPTGGGKSLTYQLPALICPGITLVVSPLVSLIQDQIMHLLQANIPAAYLSANMEWNEQQEILRELSSGCSKYKLLYVTPEKVAKSDVLLRHLESLHASESLSRIVIDEAHCVSQWGHDFRPDYQSLGILKQKFPRTPVLALTATATASVKEDVVQALGLVNCIVFRQSFNRHNLRYSVMAKTKKCLDDINTFIKENHFNECGIVYCLSRMDCEKVAEKLQGFGHKASFYHGSMDPQQRAFVQKQWSKDEINIICATVAFGMGINKPDVRFVIHHSLPKSVEGYHQECGRAGRDGQRSSCVLYYSYSDYIRLKCMVSQTAPEQSPFASGSRRTTTSNPDRIHVENLLRMVGYCENDVDCRRLLQLIHFGENFDPANCRKTCDNCSKNIRYIEKDITEISKQLIELVKLTRQQHSLSYILEVYRGSLSQNVKKYNHEKLPLHGAGKHLAKGEASRILRHLVTEDLLVEEVKQSDYGSYTSILKVNEAKASKLRFGGQKLFIRFPAPTKAAKLNKEATPAKGPLTEKISSTPSDTPAHKADLNVSAKIFSALRILRTVLVKENGDGCMAYHIFKDEPLQQISQRVPRTRKELLGISGMSKVKVNKYGNRILETIDSIIKEHYKTDKNNGSSNDSSESTKRRRESMMLQDLDPQEEDFAESTTVAKKRTLKKYVDYDDSKVLNYDDCIDSDLDDSDDDDIYIIDSNTKTGRVLPTWSTPGTKVVV
ncbi:hypothetical protein GIB67_026220 [Kingdonia uniflora]|uniref:DNA 3'-5' helicase n=1 Tax=Kingdonia uniflora TaxID=39325 RepID=A0A7J7LA00_9MAGN|nr:hypothetical protein GIB67_026220 [Kingdonia uniflora]